MNAYERKWKALKEWLTEHQDTITAEDVYKQMLHVETKECPICLKDFEGRGVYCSEGCRKEAHRRIALESYHRHNAPRRCDYKCFQCKRKECIFEHDDEEEVII